MSDKHKTKEEYIRNAKANIPTLSKEHEKHLAYMWEHYYLRKGWINLILRICYVVSFFWWDYYFLVYP